MGFLSPSVPVAPPIPPAAAPASMANPLVASAANNARGRAAGGYNATVGTTPMGLVAPPSTGQSKLLGG